jgi:hypothetical protein
MRTRFIVPAANGTYTSPTYDATVNTQDTMTINIVTFEFFNDAALTVPSTGVTGTITVNGKMSANSGWQNIPNSASPSTVNAASPLSPTFSGIVEQLQIITSTMVNTNYINVILDVQKSS